MKHILFVCWGNACRSPLAESILRKILDERGKNGIEVESRGFTPNLRRLPAGTLEVMKELGLIPPARGPRRVVAEDLEKADLVVVMEPAMRKWVMELAPEAENRTLTLRELAGEPPGSIEDPYLEGAEKYRECAQEIRNCLEQAIKRGTL